ncbi:hypothetical protein D3C76_1485450 [compost metagenome]
MRCGGVGGIAYKNHPATKPRLMDEKHLHRFIDRLLAILNLLLQITKQPVKSCQWKAHVFHQRVVVHPWLIWLVRGQKYVL